MPMAQPAQLQHQTAVGEMAARYLERYGRQFDTTLKVSVRDLHADDPRVLQFIGERSDAAYRQDPRIHGDGDVLKLDPREGNQDDQPILELEEIYRRRPVRPGAVKERPT